MFISPLSFLGRVSVGALLLVSLYYGLCDFVRGAGLAGIYATIIFGITAVAVAIIAVRAMQCVLVYRVHGAGGRVVFALIAACAVARGFDDVLRQPADIGAVFYLAAYVLAAISLIWILHPGNWLRWFRTKRWRMFYDELEWRGDDNRLRR